MKSLLVALTLSASLLCAQDPGIPAYEDLEFPQLRQVELPDVAEYTLPNGIRLYLLEDRELPLIGGFAMVRTGNLFDPEDKVGLASVTGEVMRSGGTKDRTGDEIDEQLENIAASVESSIGETSGSVSFSCLSENAGEVLAVFKEVLTAPEFRQDKIDLSKTQYRSVISRRNDDAGSIASREFNEILYGRDNPYGWRMEYETLDAIARDDLIAFHKRYFFPANVIIAIQGDFSAVEMRGEIERLFADWTVEQPAVPEFPTVSAKPDPRAHLAVKKDVNQTFLRAGHLGGMLKDEDYPALEVMADILGGGFSSRLFAKIRTELGYAYGIGAYWGVNYNHPGLFTISGSTKAGSTTETIQAVMAEIERIRTGEVTDKELATAKDTVLNGFVFNFDSPGKTLRRIVRYEYFGYPPDFIFKYQKAVESVTKEDVLRVAKQYLRPEDFTIVAAGNPDEFGEPLTALGKTIVPVDLTIPEPKREMAQADAGSLAKGQAMLAKLQEAVGGAEKIAAVTDFVRVTEVTIQSPQGPMKVNQNTQWLAPSRFRQVQTLPFGTMTASFDGTSGWLAAQGQVQTMPAPVIKQVRGGLLRNPFQLWVADRQEGWTVNAVDDAVVEVSDGKGQVVRVEIDQESGLPVRLLYESVQLSGPVSKLEETFDDWREVEGVKLPHKITTTRDGSPYSELIVREMTLNTGLTAEAMDARP